MEKLENQEVTSLAETVHRMITCASCNRAKKFGGKWGMLDKFLAKSQWNGKKPFLPIFIHFLQFLSIFDISFIALLIKPNALIALWVWFFADIATLKSKRRSMGVFSFCRMYDFFLGFLEKPWAQSSFILALENIWERNRVYLFSSFHTLHGNMKMMNVKEYPLISFHTP